VIDRRSLFISHNAHFDDINGFSFEGLSNHSKGSAADFLNSQNQVVDPKPKIPAANAFAYVGDSALLAGVNQLSELTKFLDEPPQLSANQVKKIKPGVVSIRSDWNVTRAGVEGNVLWLKVSRKGTSGTSMPVKVLLDELPTRLNNEPPSSLYGFSEESRHTLQASFMAIHKQSLLAFGGLTESSTPMASNFANLQQLPLAKDARLRFANDWNKTYRVKDKAPLEPGINPHGRRGIIVDDGVIWFDDVERPYFEEVEM